MPSHIGISIGSRWVVSILDSDLNTDQYTLNYANQLSIADLDSFCNRGDILLESLEMGLKIKHFSPDLYFVKSAAGIQVLPSDPDIIDPGIPHVSWGEILNKCTDERILDRLFADYLSGVISQLEEISGVRLVPSLTVSVCLDGFGSEIFRRTLSNSLMDVFKCEPVFMWSPTAAAGWINGIRKFRHTVIRKSQSVELAWKDKTVTAEFNCFKNHIFSRLIYGRQSSEVPIVGHLMLNSQDVEGAAASGAAMWGYFQNLTQRTICEQSSVTFSVGGERDYDNRIELLPVKIEPVGLLSKNYFARSIRLSEIPTGSTEICLRADAPWLDRGMPLICYVFTRQDVVDRWHMNFSIVVESTPSQNMGKMFILYGDSCEYIERCFQLMPRQVYSNDIENGQIPDIYNFDSSKRYEDAVAECTPEIICEPKFSVNTPGKTKGKNDNDVTITDIEILTLCNPGMPQRASASFTVDVSTDSFLDLNNNPVLWPFDMPHPYIVHVLHFGSNMWKFYVNASKRSWNVRSLSVGPNLRLYTVSIEFSDGCRKRRIGHVKWKLKFTKPTSRKNKAKHMVVIEKEIERVPKNYGLSVELKWSADEIDLLSPIPICRGKDSGLQMDRPAVTGLINVKEKQSARATTFGRGQLKLVNSGPYILEVTINPGGGIRLWTDSIKLNPGRECVLEVARRRTIRPDFSSDYQNLHVECMIKPLGDSISRVQPVSIKVMDKTQTSQAIILPEQGIIKWVLNSWLEAGQCQIRVGLSKPIAVEVIVQPMTRKNCGKLAKAVPIDNSGNESPWLANINFPFQSAKLLEWFPCPMDRIFGKIEVLQELQDCGPVRIEYDFEATIEGVISIQRELKIECLAGRAIVIPIQLLCSDGEERGLEAILRWKTFGVPYNVKCKLYDAKPDDISEDRSGQRQIRTYTLPDNSVLANSHLKVNKWLALYPVNANCWEQGQWDATIVLKEQNHKKVDEIEMGYSLRPYKPNVGIKLQRSRIKKHIYCTLGIKNKNPISTLYIYGISLKISMSILGITIAKCSGKMRYPLKNCLIIKPGSKNYYNGYIPHKSRWFWKLRSVLLKKAKVKISLDTSLDGRTENGRNWLFDKEVSIESK